MDSAKANEVPQHPSSTTDHSEATINRINEAKQLIQELNRIRQSAIDLEAEREPSLQRIHPTYEQSARNLLHYIALRRHDLRPLQKRLSALGLSSIGRAESHVMASIKCVMETLSNIAQLPLNDLPNRIPINDGDEGRSLLQQHTDALFGKSDGVRETLIMVTMPSEAATDPLLISNLVVNGMDCMRINCAHDDADQWLAMIRNLRHAEQSTGKKCRILMDLAGPKLRTGPIEAGEQVVKWRPQRNRLGHVTAPARIWLYPDGESSESPETCDACLPVCGKWLKHLKTGDRIRFIDERGSRRSLRVVETAGHGCWTEANQTAYVTTGTTLRARIGKGTSAAKIYKTKLGQLPAIEQVLVLNEGDTLILTRDEVLGRPAQWSQQGVLVSPAHIGCTLPSIFADVRVGESIWFDDGKIGGTIESVEVDQLHVRIVQARVGGEKLRADKGINLPDSTLHQSGLTEKDIRDLPFIVAHADLVGFSFVRSAADVEELEARLQILNGDHLGIILKIETRRAFEQLPAMLLASMSTPCDGVMIARGDLAIECGFERLAEVQEQILWICEAAHVPVIWATQVLESVAKDGLATRAEVSDAASSQRAECVMLNKGPHIVKAVQTLENILRRMAGHQQKKRSLLRPLELAIRFQNDSRPE